MLLGLGAGDRVQSPVHAKHMLCSRVYPQLHKSHHACSNMYCAHHIFIRVSITYCFLIYTFITCDLIKIKSLKKKHVYKTQSYLQPQNTLWIFISLIEYLFWGNNWVYTEAKTCIKTRNWVKGGHSRTYTGFRMLSLGSWSANRQK